MGGEASEKSTRAVRRGSGDGMVAEGFCSNTGSPAWWGAGEPQPATRERQAGPCWVAERLVVPVKPGNAGGGKEPWFKGNDERGRERGD
jgi:hypothetical protein